VVSAEGDSIMREVTCIQVATAQLGASVKRSGAELLWRCPNHDDQHPSLQVNEKKNTWLCGPCGKGGTAWQLAAFLTGLSESDKAGITGWFRDHGLLMERIRQQLRRIVAEYDYLDERGAMLYQTIRFEPKGFAYRHIDDNFEWVWSLQGCRLIPYHLPAVLTAETVWVCEGEKNCDDLAEWGLAATTNPMGAGKWRPEFNEHFAGRHVCILPDNDDPGRKHAQDVAANLLPVAWSVRIVELPALAPKGDVSDWKAAGGTLPQLLGIAGGLPPLTHVAVPSGPFRDLSEVPNLGAIPNVAVSWLIQDFIPMQALTLLVGPKGSYKSWMALDLAARLAGARGFAGRPGAAEREVIYLDRENPASVIRIRKDMLATGDPAALHYWGQWEQERPCDLYDPRLLQFCAKRQPVLILDSLLRWSKGDENSADQMAKTTELLRSLVSLGATLVVIAHRSDKPGSPDYRGSSELLAGCDMAWQLGRRQDDRRVVDLRCLKNRFAEEADFAVRLEAGGFVKARPPVTRTAVGWINGQERAGAELPPVEGA
jgi:hypothetical protein